MGQNPIEDNFVLSFLLGLSVLFAMSLVGHGIGTGLLELGVPYGAWIGVAIAIGVVFTAFVSLYRRYDAAYSTA